MSARAPKFQVHCALQAFEKANAPEGQEMRIGGIVTTDDLDKQDEEVVQTGLDFSPFLREGWYNDNHGQKTVDVLGYPTDAKYVRKGERLPNGKIADRSGWWTEGYLLHTPEGRKTWQLCQALAKSPRKLGFSIEGKVLKRDAMNKKRITRAVVKNVAITHCPVNVNTEMHALAKALSAGSSVSNPGSAPGVGFALRKEALEGGVADAASPSDFDEDALWIGTLHEMEHTSDPLKAQEIAMDHLSEDPDYYKKLKTITKAEEPSDFRIVDELDLMDEWAPYLSDQLENLEPPRLSKAEARIIVKQRYPKLSLAEIDSIIEHAATQQ